MFVDKVLGRDMAAVQQMRQAVKILLTNFKELSHKERTRYVYDALFLWVFRDKIEWKKLENLADREHLLIEKVFLDTKNKILSNQKVQPDDFCLDFHAGTQKKTTETMINFRQVGAQVHNECPLFTIPFFKNYYE